MAGARCIANSAYFFVRFLTGFFAAFFVGAATSTPSKPSDFARLRAEVRTAELLLKQLHPSDLRANLVGLRPGIVTVPWKDSLPSVVFEVIFSCKLDILICFLSACSKKLGFEFQHPTN